jgi:hypothetical protein
LPTIQSAKTIAENALSQIGAFPASRSAPDPGEMKKALRWLEMLLNHQAAIRPVGSFWRVFDVPLEAGIGDYDLSDYADESGVCHVFSVFLVDTIGNADPLELIYQSAAAGENLSSTGRPSRATVKHEENVSDGVLSVYPCPTQTEEDAGLVLRLRVETFHKSLDVNGTGDQDVKLRPSWYLWITKRLGYEIGSGPVRRLSEGELKRLGDDATALENALLARDGQNISARPPVTESNDPCPDHGWGCG